MLETLKGTDTGTGGGAHRNNDDSSSHQVTEEGNIQPCCLPKILENVFLIIK